MPIKVSFPFGEKHPIPATLILIALEGVVLWALWKAVTRGVIGGKHGNSYAGDPGFYFEIAFLGLAMGAVAIPALIFKVLSDRSAKLKRDQPK